eukprot:s194_g41.t1
MIFITVILAINLEKMVKYIYNKIHSKPKRLLPIKDEFPDGAAPMDVDKNLDMMEVTLKIRQDALDNIEERLLEKQTESQHWLNYSQQVCDQLSTAQTDKKHAAGVRERFGELLEQAKDDKEKFLVERNELEDKHAVLQDKYDKKARGEAEERDRRRDCGALFQQPAAPSDAEEALKRKVTKLEADVVQLQRLNGQYSQEIQSLRTQLAKKKAPARMFLTRSGSCYHEASCNHLKHGHEDRPRQEFKRCKDWRPFMVKDSKGNRGWISALSKEGTILLEITKRGNQNLNGGTGQASSTLPEHGPRPQDICVCKIGIVMRWEEDVNSDMIRRLPAGEKLEILKPGADPKGRPFMVKDSKGNRGWISALNQKGTYVVEVKQRGLALC